MENIIEGKLNALLKLQTIDCELDHITKLRGALPEEVKTLENELTRLQTRSQSIQEELSELEQLIATQRVRMKEIEPWSKSTKHSR